ncbi:MAG: F0F1 ATP synthase subunit A [Candidatus Latescibacter sp.]|nr:F0F1 ATP synthase subunit A [Candidatus Latescibacter sp.]
MSGKQILYLILAVFILEVAVLIILGAVGKEGGKEKEAWFQIGPVAVEKHGMELESIGKVEKYHLDNTPPDKETFWAIDIFPVKMMLLVDVLLIFAATLTAVTLRRIPGRLQSFIEIVVDFFRSIILETLGEHGDRHVPTLLTLFFFIWISNIIGVIPRLGEPTRDLNIIIGHMLVMIFLVHFEAIRIKGIKAYIHEYFQPFFIMAPLNVIGEISKGISLSVRLFGNISGGAIIIVVISYLIKYTVLPVGLNLFFGLFVGTIQAFVFTVLSMTYLAVAIAE